MNFSTPPSKDFVYDMSPVRRADASLAPNSFANAERMSLTPPPHACFQVAYGLQMPSPPLQYVAPLQVSMPSIDQICNSCSVAMAQGSQHYVVASPSGYKLVSDYSEVPIGEPFAFWAANGCAWPSLPGGKLGEISPPDAPRVTGLREGRLWPEPVQVQSSPAVHTPLLLVPSPQRAVPCGNTFTALAAHAMAKTVAPKTDDEAMENSTEEAFKMQPWPGTPPSKTCKLTLPHIPPYSAKKERKCAPLIPSFGGCKRSKDATDSEETESDDEIRRINKAARCHGPLDSPDLPYF